MTNTNGYFNMSKSGNIKSFISRLKKQWPILLFLLPGLFVFIVFSYLPIYGLIGAFQDFSPIKGFMKSEWVGLDNFKVLFNLPDFWMVVKNTLRIGVLKIIFAFPAPLIFALMLNELRNGVFKRLSQTLSYIPYFISWVVASGIWYRLLSSTGAINDILQFAGLIDEPIYFFSETKHFTWIVVMTHIWKNVGFESIIYLAALTSINPESYEAADIDGASKAQKIWYISIPSISPTILLLFILTLSNILRVGFEQIWTLQNPQIYKVSEVIDTYIFRIIMQGTIKDYSRGIAFGLVSTIICLVLFFTGNKTMKKMGLGSLY